MEQTEISKQLPGKSGEVNAAIVKPTESRESAILPSLGFTPEISLQRRSLARISYRLALAAQAPS